MDSRLWLEKQFRARIERNSHYSLRSFAGLLGISPGRVSELLRGQRVMTPTLAGKIADRLKLPQDERSALVTAARKNRRRAPQARVNTAISTAAPHPRYHILSRDTFDVIAEWQHYGILALIETDDFRGDEKWIAARLGLSRIAANQALDRLLRVGLIHRSDGCWRLTGRNLASTADIPSESLRQHHRQQLAKGVAALDSVPVEEREFASTTMAIDPDRMVEAKRLITEFRRQLCAFLEGGKKREVYSLNIQLFPLTLPAPAVCAAEEEPAAQLVRGRQLPDREATPGFAPKLNKQRR